jgi:hypothetical protein
MALLNRLKIVYGETASNDGAAVIYLETIRDVAAFLGVDGFEDTLEKRTVLHEVVHAFGYRHDPADPARDMGIMSGDVILSGTDDANHLMPEHIALIQASRYPGFW